MKTNRSIYFIMIILGAITMGKGDYWIIKEYALGIGIVMLMFGVFKTSQTWTESEDGE